MEFTVKRIGEENRADIDLPNEPFELIGWMKPELRDGEWSYGEVLRKPEEIREMCFPEENYDFEAMQGEYIFLGAYEGDKCVGLAIFRQDMFRYLYLYDLKVSKAYRGKGVGQALIAGAMEQLVTGKYIGIYTIGQDDNLKACRFYLKNGFTIGGFNNRGYDGTGQQGKADIYFYLKKGMAGNER